MTTPPAQGAKLEITTLSRPCLSHSPLEKDLCMLSTALPSQGKGVSMTSIGFGGGGGEGMDASSRSVGFQYGLRPQLCNGQGRPLFWFLLFFILVSVLPDNSWWLRLAN